MRSHWGYYGCHFGGTLGLFFDYYRISLRVFSITLRVPQSHLGQLSDHFGGIFGSLYGFYRDTLNVLWGEFYGSFESSGDILVALSFGVVNCLQLSSS